MIVFTTFPEPEFDAALRWYRLRWQVELVFKRSKSLARLGHLLKRDSDSARVPPRLRQARAYRAHAQRRARHRVRKQLAVYGPRIS